MKQEQVNHPLHYNMHPEGIECIDVIRHYTCDIANAMKYLWRAGLKPEMGKKDIEKEIEDLNKALWYIQDYYRNGVRFGIPMDKEEVGDIVFEVTGSYVEHILAGYTKAIAIALSNLLGVGIIFQGEVRHVTNWRENLLTATQTIMARIDNLEESKEE